MALQRCAYKYHSSKGEVVRDYLSGMTSYEVAAKYGIGNKTVLRWVQEAGGQVRPIGGKRSPHRHRENEIVAYYQDGHSAQETASHFGIGQMVVLRMVRRQGAVRTVGEGLAASQSSQAYYRRRSEAMIGGVSPAKGKTWKVEDPSKMGAKKGALNPSWKGGVTPLSSSIRNSLQYAEWRASVFKRDNYTCVLCGARTKAGMKVRIDADHIYPLSRLIERHRITTIEQAAACEALWDVGNGRTLCRQCHQETETWGVNAGKGEW